MKSISRILASVLLLTPLSVAAIPVLLTDIAGQLIGANGVSIDATDDGVDNALLYDVAFRDDSCSNIFGNSCDGDTDFDFTTEFGAVAASNALSEQVFVGNGAVLFDTQPGRTFGCAPSTPSSCIVWTPYADLSDNSVFIAGFHNAPQEALDITLQGWLVFDDHDYRLNDTEVYAVWKRSAISVPEPTAIALLGLGLVGVGWARRKQLNND